MYKTKTKIKCVGFYTLHSMYFDIFYTYTVYFILHTSWYLLCLIKREEKEEGKDKEELDISRKEVRTGDTWN